RARDRGDRAVPGVGRGRVRHRQGARGGRRNPGAQPRPRSAGPVITHRVVQWSTGNVGRHAIAGIDARPDLELAGVWVSTSDKVGRDAGALAGLGRTLGVTATNDAAELLALRPDCVVYAAMADDRLGEAIEDP